MGTRERRTCFFFDDNRIYIRNYKTNNAPSVSCDMSVDETVRSFLFGMLARLSQEKKWVKQVAIENLSHTTVLRYHKLKTAGRVKKPGKLATDSA